MKLFSWIAGTAARRRRAGGGEQLILETERKALLRLGALAGSAPIQDLFDAMAEELGRIVDIETGETFQDMAGVSRFDPDGLITFVAGWGPGPGGPSPARAPGPPGRGKAHRRRLPPGP